ncbi:unnamed protein product, partial [Closterium sp. Naga37s-1]
VIEGGRMLENISEIGGDAFDETPPVSQSVISRQNPCGNAALGEADGMERRSDGADLFRVVIVGAGPAGLVLANHLLTRGGGRFHVSVVEKSEDPRKKVEEAVEVARRYSIGLNIRAFRCLDAVPGLLKKVLACMVLVRQLCIAITAKPSVIPFSHKPLPSSISPSFRPPASTLQDPPVLLADRTALCCALLHALVGEDAHAGVPVGGNGEHEGEGNGERPVRDNGESKEEMCARGGRESVAGKAGSGDSAVTHGAGSSRGKLDLFFNMRCTGIDINAHTVTLQPAPGGDAAHRTRLQPADSVERRAVVRGAVAVAGASAAGVASSETRGPAGVDAQRLQQHPPAQLSYDLLVGADGVRSVVRSALVSSAGGFAMEALPLFGEWAVASIPAPTSLPPNSMILVPRHSTSHSHRRHPVVCCAACIPVVCCAACIPVVCCAACIPVVCCAACIPVVCCAACIPVVCCAACIPVVCCAACIPVVCCAACIPVVCCAACIPVVCCAACIPVVCCAACIPVVCCAACIPVVRCAACIPVVCCAACIPVVCCAACIPVVCCAACIPVVCCAACIPRPTPFATQEEGVGYRWWGSLLNPRLPPILPTPLIQVPRTPGISVVGLPAQGGKLCLLWAWSALARPAEWLALRSNDEDREDHAVGRTDARKVGESVGSKQGVTGAMENAAGEGSVAEGSVAGGSVAEGSVAEGSVGGGGGNADRVVEADGEGEEGRERGDDKGGQVKQEGRRSRARAYIEERVPWLGMTEDGAETLLNQQPRTSMRIKCWQYHDSAAQIALIGDSAHATCPSLGQGCNAAITDATVLARLLLGEVVCRDTLIPPYTKETTWKLLQSVWGTEGNEGVDSEQEVQCGTKGSCALSRLAWSFTRFVQKLSRLTGLGGRVAPERRAGAGAEEGRTEAGRAMCAASPQHLRTHLAVMLARYSALQVPEGHALVDLSDAGAPISNLYSLPPALIRASALLAPAGPAHAGHPPLPPSSREPCDILPQIISAAWRPIKKAAQVVGKLGNPTLLTHAGAEALWREHFWAPPDEKLLFYFYCNLLTSVGPVPGTLVVTTASIGFLSDAEFEYNPLGRPTEIARSHFVATIPLHKITGVAPEANPSDDNEKYIRLTTEDDFSFWFTGFIAYDQAFATVLSAVVSTSHLLEALS